MKKLIAVIFLLSAHAVSFGQFPVPADSLYVFIRSNSILRNTVEWDQVDKTFREQIATAGSLKDTMNRFVAVLRSLNDVHSQIFLDNEYYGHYAGFEDSVLVWLKPLNDRSIAGTNKIHTEIIGDEIGYIRVPSIQAFDQVQINGFAQSLADSIVKLSGRSKRGFIIDLRLNGGGNIYPMLSGLSLFLGDRVVGYETDIDDNVVRTWEMEDGNFVIGGYRATDVEVKQANELTTAPVVVLIGPVTKSSGSMVAIAFKGRPNTVFIGEPTADGYTTSNGYFQFAPNLVLNFATSYVADRDRNIYKTAVDPDVIVYRGDNFDDLPDDEKVKAAIRWLMKK